MGGILKSYVHIEGPSVTIQGNDWDLFPYICFPASLETFVLWIHLFSPPLLPTFYFDMGPHEWCKTFPELHWVSAEDFFSTPNIWYDFILEKWTIYIGRYEGTENFIASYRIPSSSCFKELSYLMQLRASRLRKVTWIFGDKLDGIQWYTTLYF